MNRALGQMDHVVHGNSAQTGELASTAQALAAQAAELQALVARFKLERGSAPPRLSPEARSPVAHAAV